MKAHRFVFLTLLLLLLSQKGLAQEVRGSAADDYLRFVPLASVYVLKGCGAESRSTWKELLVDNVMSLAVMSAATYGMKNTIHSDRPDHSDRHGFPSGHASFAFMGATVLHHEFGHLSPWVSVAGYGIATGVGVTRVARHRHTWWQAAGGAAIGVLSTEAGYWLGDKLTGRNRQLDIAATPAGIAVAYTF